MVHLSDQVQWKLVCVIGPISGETEPHSGQVSWTVHIERLKHQIYMQVYMASNTQIFWTYNNAHSIFQINMLHKVSALKKLWN
jgi:hypothetical protein